MDVLQHLPVIKDILTTKLKIKLCAQISIDEALVFKIYVVLYY